MKLHTKILTVFLMALFGSGYLSGQNAHADSPGKPALMWFDAEANFERFSYPDSIDFYLKKIKDLGFTHAVVDVRPITGEVLFDSQFAPKMEEWMGYQRKDFDYLGYFIQKGHELGLEVHAALNVFVGGHNYYDRGQTYTDHPEWASMVYTPKDGIVSIMSEKHKYSAMINPIHPEFQKHILGVLTELVQKYPELDGLMLDRVRYDGITADFSDKSKEAFQCYVGKKMKRFPEDIFEWVPKEGNSQEFQIKRGDYFLKWIEWRAKVIRDFMALARQEVKAINPAISFGTYTGAWYPSYYEVGVNFASKNYDPVNDFDWAGKDYKNSGYAELMDLYATGNYYTDITIKDALRNNKSVWNETDSHAHSGTWYSVEGACEKLRSILLNNKFMGGVLVDQFYDNPFNLTKSIEMNLKKSDGLMVFDIVHIIQKDLWKEVEAGMVAGGQLPARVSDKSKLMWLDCSANFKRFSYPDSIRYYVDKCAEIGITHLILDIKDNSGEVLYPSKYATHKTNWKNHDRPDFDFINTFIEAARERNLEIFAALNIFSDGQGVFQRGAIYDKHKKWQGVNYVPGKGLVPMTEIPDKGSLFLNPALKAVQKYELNILKEVVANYAFDGIILDRARYDAIDSDFSPESKKMFEKYIGKKVARFPEDIFEWRPNNSGSYDRVAGPYYQLWIEWRASVIYNFMKEARSAVKSVNPDCIFGAYTGAWYPSYFEVGVNWASQSYDVHADFSWATPKYKDYGFAELLDFYTNGNYYWNVTLAEYRASKGIHKNETDSQWSSGEHLCVEGGCLYSKNILKGAVPLAGGLYVEDYKKDEVQFKNAVEMSLKASDGVMIFDIVHIIQNNWWTVLKEAIDSSSAYE
jgi:uncharacterized lipoprotein YddW (UPF0748 family)